MPGIIMMPVNFMRLSGIGLTDYKSQPFQRYALFTEDAYPFAVLLFALFHAGKEVWIPGNNRPGTAQQLQQLDCQLIGDWDTASRLIIAWNQQNVPACRYHR